MFDFVKNRRTIVAIIIGLLAIPFAFFGIDFYFTRGGAGDEIAKVGRSRITQREFGDALRQRQGQLREAMRGQVDAAMLDSVELRQAVLTQLVDERVLYAAALKEGVTVSDAELRNLISGMEEFEDENGKFSITAYEAMLKRRGMSQPMFESLVRKDILLARARQGIGATAFVPNAVTDRLYRLGGQEREVSQIVFDPTQFAPRVKLQAGAAQAFYDANKQQFTIPERVRVEYVLLSLDGVQRQTTVSDDEIKEYYEAHRNQFSTPEQRRTSHILVQVPATATPEDRAKARARAEQLLAEARKAPKGFADLARKNSDDPGSAAEGGDLGFNPRGRMVPPFDEATFTMKVGEIAGPVETQYGYHVIRLDEVRAGEGTTLEAVRSKVEEEVRRTKSGKRFAEIAESFSDSVYRQADSLKPTADTFSLEPRTSSWLTRQGGEEPLLSNEKLLRAVFTDDVLKNGQNTEAIEIMPNMLVAARVVERQEPTLRPFSEVQSEIERELTRQQSIELAKSEGEATLDKLKKGEPVTLSWSPPQVVTRERREGLHPDATRAVFSADASKLPAYLGLTATDGRYVVYRLSRVIDMESVDAARRKQLSRQLDQVLGREEEAARLFSLKEKADVKINPTALERDG